MTTKKPPGASAKERARKKHIARFTEFFADANNCEALFICLSAARKLLKQGDTAKALELLDPLCDIGKP